MSPRPTQRQCRDFGLLLSAIFLIVALVHLVRGETWSDTPALWVQLALVLVPVTLLEPNLFTVPCRVFLTVGKGVNFVMVPTLLIPFFFVVVLPFGLVGRLFRWDPMSRRSRPKTETLWQTPRPEERGLERYEQPF